MSATVNVNGLVSDQEHAVISVFDHGFLYGEGVYETLRTYNGQPFLFERHIAALSHVGAHLEAGISVKEVVPIVRVDHRTIGSGVPGPITKALLDGYRRHAKALTRS